MPGPRARPRFEPTRVVQAWPRVDAPGFVPALKVFDVVVGFADVRQVEVTGDPVRLPVPAGAEFVDITVELTTTGLDAVGGWSRPLRVPVADMSSAEVTFQLVGQEPDNAQRMHLTMLEVRYVVGGTVCGTAARPLIVMPSANAGAPPELPFGTPWLKQPFVNSGVALTPDPQEPDLTIEILKLDGNESSGRFVCRLRSPHPIGLADQPFDIDLSQDARSFARAAVDKLRVSSPVLREFVLKSFGLSVTSRLPRAVFESLENVGKAVAPAVPAVLIVSDEHFVPWELAWIAAPLDPARPRYLGAQALVGRWLRAPAETGEEATPRPALQPISRLAVRRMAVMAGLYRAESGLRALPQAQAEAEALTKLYKALALDASPESIARLLAARLPDDGVDGPVEAVHFAGHGEFDPARPDSSMLFLSDGSALDSMLFRAAEYGGLHQPLLFLNACTVGVGGDVLGDMGGFPGNSLRGGFGGVLGPLWEVDDTLAHEMALEFWQRALTSGEPVAAILRDLRARVQPDPGKPAVPTYLAYVFYGHPRLTLEHAV